MMYSYRQAATRDTNVCPGRVPTILVELNWLIFHPSVFPDEIPKFQDNYFDLFPQDYIDASQQ